jgi:hypothetical protein
MKTEFTKYSEIQSLVEHTINVGGTEKSDKLYINIDSTEPKITLSIENETTDDSADFSISSEHFAKIVDWLKEMQILK